MSQKLKQKNWWLIGFALAACVYAAFFFAQPINLSTADLGRHIVNGELIANGISEVLTSNYYSFTEPKHAFVNHHWGSGVVFYWIHSLFGFEGLSVLYILLSVLALVFMVMGSERKDGWALPILATLPIIPLLAYRVEVRPEGFSYVLIGLYYWLFSAVGREQISVKKVLPLLLLLQICWVNLHIFFFFGILISGVFLVDALLNSKKSEVKWLLITTLALIAVSLINPHTYKGLLAPLTIFNEYGYMVAENQSISFMLDRFGNPELYHFVVFGILAVLMIVLAIYRKVWRSMMIEILLVALFGILAAVAVRGIPMFALVFAPFAAKFLAHLLADLNHKTKESIRKLTPIVGLGYCLLFIMLKGTHVSARSGYEQLGLIENIDGCGKFLRTQQIPGKMFNNYDIGSYLIYYLHDRQKVFVDNRPEAYSVQFFDSIYKPMQEDDALWKEKSLEYGINTICFYRLDNTPWAQPFLIRRTQDPDWVPIYVDQVSLILIRNTPTNQRWIQQFALSRGMFSGVPN